MKLLTKREINKLLDQILDNTDFDLENVDWIRELVYSPSKVKRANLDDKFCDTLTFFGYYLLVFEEQEEFEICAKIQKAMEVSKQETLRIFQLIYKKEGKNFNLHLENHYLTQLQKGTLEHLRKVYNEKEEDEE